MKGGGGGGGLLLASFFPSFLLMALTAGRGRKKSFLCSCFLLSQNAEGHFLRFLLMALTVGRGRKKPAPCSCLLSENVEGPFLLPAHGSDSWEGTEGAGSM